MGRRACGQQSNPAVLQVGPASHDGGTAAALLARTASGQCAQRLVLVAFSTSARTSGPFAHLDLKRAKAPRGRLKGWCKEGRGRAWDGVSRG